MTQTADVNQKIISFLVVLQKKNPNFIKHLIDTY
jgi:hypothetical protein